jgi:hypothetical protein
VTHDEIFADRHRRDGYADADELQQQATLLPRAKHHALRDEPANSDGDDAQLESRDDDDGIQTTEARTAAPKPSNTAPMTLGLAVSACSARSILVAQLEQSGTLPLLPRKKYSVPSRMEVLHWAHADMEAS